jgi:peptidoglycan/xylan/chitin deacetylase (PgdA/CDA1 family)
MDWNAAPNEKTRAEESAGRAQARRLRRARASARRRGRIRLLAMGLALVVILGGGWAIASSRGPGHRVASPPASSTASSSGTDLQNEANAAAGAYLKAQPRPRTWDLSKIALAAIPADAAVRHATTAKKVVALTFDDGPSEYSTQLLAELKDLGVPATFFVIGRQIAGFENVVAAESSLGNVVGNHTWAHVDLARTRKKQVRSQVADTSEAIFHATGRRPTLLRPPYGSTTRAVNAFLRTRSLVPTLWDVDSEDWRGIAREQIVANVLAAVSPGSIVLMHDGGGDRSPTIAAVPEIVEKLRGRGYTFATVPELLDSGPPSATTSAFFLGNG